MNKHPMQPDPISADLNHRLITSALMAVEWPTLNLKDEAAVKARIQEYFQTCDRLELRPSNLGLYAALGQTKTQISNIMTGRDKNKVTPETCSLIQKAQTALSSYREQLALHGKVSPPIAIFWSKNFDHMTDYQTIEISRADTMPGPVTITAEEARAALDVMDDTEDDEEGSY